MDQDLVRNVPDALLSRAGWPWESGELDAYLFPASLSWPRITLVTPSFNQAQFLEETLRSVLLQGYPNLEYIVLDGGSTDGSCEVLHRYAPYLTYWRSEKDAGQSAAISEGFSMATGEILGWLNSDDFLLPGCLQKVASYFMQHPQDECVVGGVINIDASGKIVRDRMGLPKITLGGRETFKSLLMRNGCNFMQPASFWRRKAYLAVGGLDSNLVFVMDYDLYLRLAYRRPFGHINHLLACFRRHSESKTTKLQPIRLRESDVLRKRHGLDAFPVMCRRMLKIYFSVIDRIKNLPVRIAVATKAKKLYPELSVR